MEGQAKERTAGDLLDQVVRLWGAQRADELRPDVEAAADAIFRVLRHRAEIDADEPDFLVAAGWRG